MTDYASIIADLDQKAAQASSAPPPADAGWAAASAPFDADGQGRVPAPEALPQAESGQPTGLPPTQGTVAPSANPYASVISEVDQARAMAGQLALYGAKDANPDTAAKAAALQQQMGGSSIAIEKDLPAFEAQAQALQNQQILARNPALADWMNANPLAPRVSKDDVQNLSTVSSWAKQWSQGWSDGVTSNALARLYAQGAAADPQRISALEASMKASDDPGASTGVVHFLATVAGGMADSIAHAAPFAAAGAATGAAIGATTTGLPSAGTLLPVGAGAGAATGAGVGFETGMFLDGYRTNAGTVMHALDSVRDANGNPIDPNARAVAGFLAGTVGGALNLAGLGAAGRAIGSGIAGLFGEGVAQAVARPGVGAALARAGINIGKGGLTGAGLGALTEASNVLAGQVARVASGPNFDTILNDPQQRQQAIDDIADSAATMALQLGAIHGVGSLPPLIADAMRARRSSDDLNALHGLVQTAQDSATQTRAPSIFENWVQSQTEGGRGENVFAPGDVVQQLYQARDVPPGPDDGLFGQFVPDIREQLEQARQTGGDIVMPTAGFVSHMAGTPEAEALMPHLRIGEDGMSQTDVDGYMAAHADMLGARADDLQRQADADRVATTGTQAVYDDAFGQLRAAGYAPDTADQYATLLASRYGARADRLGDDPLALYRDENLNIQGPDNGLMGTVPRNPDRPQPRVPDNLDMLIEAARSDRPEETDGGLFGPSMMQFLARRGGVEDPGGDLTALGAADWHKGKPGTRRFVRPARDDAPGLPGMDGATDNRFSPDDATRAAWEAGYLPGAERPDINALHDAVRSELDGKPIYTEQSTSRAAEFRGAVRDLQQELDRRGIDVKTASNAEIRAALEDGRQDLGQPLPSGDRKPVSHITGEEIAPKDTALPDLRSAARDFYAQNLRGTSVHSAALGRDVEFRGSRKAFSASANPDKLRLFAALRDVIAHGRLEQSAAPRDLLQEATTKAYHFLTAPVDLDGHTMRVGVTVREDANGHLYYNHSPVEEVAPPVAPVDTARKAGPGGDSGGGTTYEQRMGTTPDGVNIDVREYDDRDVSATGTWREVKPDEILQPGVHVRMNLETGRNEVFEPAAQTLRGSIQLSRYGATIKLFAKRDLSTFLHESGHLFGDELLRDADREDAPQQVKDDAAAIREWVGAEPGAALTVAQHEQLARGFEAYLMEGKAPSEALRSAFRSFRAWLVGIYRSIAGLHVELTPQVREVIDRLLASDDEIARARDQQRLGGLFQSADEAGMTDAEFAAYQASVERARSRAVDGLTTKVMGDVRRQRQAWWKQQAEPIREQVQTEVDARPAQQALELLRSGRMAGADGKPGQRISLDRQELVDTYGPGVLDLLPKRVPPIYAGEGGMPADVVSSMVGMRSGDDLVKALLGHEALRRDLRSQGDKRSVRAYTIDTETHDRMVERHGEMLTDGSLETEALDQVHSERQLDVLAAELRALARRTKEAPKRRAGKPLTDPEDGTVRVWHSGSVGEGTTGRWVSTDPRYASDYRKDLPLHYLDLPENDPRLNDADYPDQGVKQGFTFNFETTPEEAGRLIPVDRERVFGRQADATERRPASRIEPTPVQVAKAWADRTIAAKSIKDGARPAVYARAEAKAGREAERALLGGDHAAAFKAKQQQLLNHALYLSAKAAKDDVDAGMRRIDRFASKAVFPNIQTDFVDRVHELLRRFGVPIRRDSDELDRGLNGVSLQSWATERLAEGNEIFIAPDLYDTSYAHPLQQLSVAQFRDLADTIKSLAHTGRQLEQVTIDGEKQARAAVVGQMVTAMSSLPQRSAREFVNQGGKTGAAGVGERAVKGVTGFHAMLLKPETIIDTLDSRDPNGIFNRAVLRPIKAAQGMENDLLAEVTGKLKNLRESLGKGYGKDFDKQVPGEPGITDSRTKTPMALKRRGVIGIALNTGNESNLQRLLDGYGWPAEAVQGLLDRHMTATDWRFVQGVWDTFEGLFPRIEAMQRRMTGVGLEKVEPREVQTRFGSYRGGYYPVIYDPNLSTLGDRIKASGDQRFEADYVRATTQKGHTISRVQRVSEPLSLDPDQMAWKLRQSVHDLAYREAIVDADKLLRNPEVVAGMDLTVGRDQRKQLDRWLQGVANDQNIDTRGLAAMDAFLHRLRTNAMVVGIGFRASTMLKHGSTALSNSIGELGPRWMLQGASEFFGSPDKMRRQYEFVTGASAEMRHRMNEIDRDVRDALRDAMGKPGIVPAIARFSHYGVAMLDMGSALPTWMGAYRKAQAEGMEEPDAVAFADKTVRNAHGANGAPDLAAIQRGSEAQKLMTMFYGFFNHVYNRQVVGVQAAASGVRNLRAGEFRAAGGDFARTLSTAFFYLAMPALIEATVAEGAPIGQDAEGWLAWAGKAIGGAVPAGIPILRDIANAALHGKNYAMSPTGQAFDSFVTLGKDAASATGLRDKPVSDRWIQHAVTTPGYVFGLPTGQVAGTTQFLADVAGGKEDPQSVTDWMRGLTFGPEVRRSTLP